MKKRKLKKFVLPTLYTSFIVLTFVCVGLINNSIEKNFSNENYAKSILVDDEEPVLKEEKEKLIVKPYTNDNIIEAVNFYSKENETSKQISGLISYENTYMPSTGILYTSDSKFNVNPVLEGTVTKISKDELLGNVIEITHNSDLISYYYSVNDIKIEENALVTSDTIIATSSENAISNNRESLYFEVYYKGNAIDPDSFYTMNINEM